MPRALQTAIWSRQAQWFLEQSRARYGPMFSMKIAFEGNWVVLSDPDLVKQVFTGDPRVFHAGEGNDLLRPLLGANSILVLDDDKHLGQRKLLLPPFHGKRMEGYAQTMSDVAVREIESWPTGVPYRLRPRLQALTLEIILRAVFGLERGATLTRLRDLLGEVLAFTESPLSVLPALQRWLRWTPTQRRFNALMAETDELIFAMIAQRRGAGGGPGLESGGPAPESGGEDIFSILLSARHEDESEMSAPELRDELMTALVAGHETTASQLAWALERLSREPEVQARLREEVDAGESEDYLNATITEILRMRPVLPNAEPRLTKREVEIGGVRYPPGVVLLASAYLVHHDPAIYPEPGAFRPERFLGVTPGTYTWLPFGGGRRRCLGASFALEEMRIALRAVMAHYELSPAGPRGETARRRSITFSPSRSATVVLHARRPVTAPDAAVLTPA